MSLLLAFDTATPTGSVALTRDGLLIGEILLHLKTTHSERLLDSIDRLLLQTGVALTDLDALAVVTGPGSFTGLRVGVASAKALSQAADKPLIGVSSLAALALNAPCCAPLVCPLLDARKGEVYAALFNTRDGRLERLSEDLVVTPEALLERLEGETLFIGDGGRVWRSLIVRRMGGRAHFVPPACDQIRAAHVAALAEIRLQNGEAGDAETVNPIYLRASEAEIAWRLRTEDGAIEG